MEKLILHEYSQSGNCYKIRLTAALLGIRMERIEYDIMKGETRTPEFRAHINPLGRIPVLQVGQRFLPESNAACFFLADGSELIPADPINQSNLQPFALVFVGSGPEVRFGALPGAPLAIY